MLRNPSEKPNPSERPTHSWYALTVRPASEKSVALSLGARGVAVFSPVYTTKRLSSDRSRDIEVPLFPGYVFCVLEPSTRLSSIAVDGVTGLGGAQKKPPALVDQRELRSIRILAGVGLPLEPWPYLSQAANVQIVNTALHHVSGILIAPGKLVVSLSLLQRSMIADLRGENGIEIAAFAPAR